jgi:hypothetical protein
MRNALPEHKTAKQIGDALPRSKGRNTKKKCMFRFHARKKGQDEMARGAERQNTEIAV